MVIVGSASYEQKPVDESSKIYKDQERMSGYTFDDEVQHGLETMYQQKTNHLKYVSSNVDPIAQAGKVELSPKFLSDVAKLRAAASSNWQSINRKPSPKTGRRIRGKT